MHVQDDLLQQTSEARCKVTMHLIADLEQMARADYLVGVPPCPPQSPKYMHMLCCMTVLQVHLRPACRGAPYSSRGEAWQMLPQPERVTSACGHDTTECCSIQSCSSAYAASLEYNVPHIVQVMRFALHKKDRRTFVDASEKHRDWYGTSHPIS